MAHTAAITRRSTRRRNDAYFTHHRLTQALLTSVEINGTVFEPCAGTGHIVQVLLSHKRGIFTNDVDCNYDTDFNLDATKAENWDRIIYAPGVNQIDWVVTNPPFNQISKILPLAYEYCRVGVAFLCRLSYLEPVRDRGDWLNSHADNLSQILVFSQPRPSFTNDGKVDSATVAWLIWRKDWSWSRIGIQSPFQFAFRWSED